jgi:hypothetical protein
MASAIARRVARLETPKLPPRVVPHVVTVATGETKAEAYRRHSASWARVPTGHRFLVIPARVATAEDAEAFDRDFYDQQTRLIADAKSERPKEGNDNEFNARLYARQHSGSDTVRSGLATAHTARKADWKPRQLRQ